MRCCALTAVLLFTCLSCDPTGSAAAGEEKPVFEEGVLLKLLQTRRSIRTYKKGPIPSSARARIEEAMLRAPSSRGRNPWEFVFVDEPTLLDKLSKAKPHGSAMLADAALAIVVCGDEDLSGAWVEDTSIAMIIGHLAAHDAGLGSVWVQIRNRPHDDKTSAEAWIQELLGLPKNLRVEAILSVGLPGEEKPGHPASSLQHNKLHRNRYQAGKQTEPSISR
jgi:nitroreductase